MNEWCEIFRTGKHKDSKGNERDWTLEDLNTICKNFEDKNPDVPICCGHIKTNSPAYGWVDALKVEGESLWAKYKNVLEEFKEANRKGLFKTRSISLTPDLILRHVAFLGAQPPAIKGLEQFCFEAGENDITIEFEGMSSCELPLPHFNEANPDDNIGKSEQSEPKGEEGASSPVFNEQKGPTSSTEEQSSVGSFFRKGEQMEKEELQEQLTKAQEENAALLKQIEDANKAAAQKEFEEFCDSAIADGHILPSQKNDVMNILTACNDGNMNFSDNEGNEKSAKDVFKNFVSGLKQMDFEEVGKKDNVKEEKNIDFSDSKALAEEIIATQNEYAKKGIELNSSQALEKLKQG